MPEQQPETGACPRCGGRGWLVEEDGGPGTARRCDCRGQSGGPGALAEAGVPPRYESCTFDSFKVSSPDALMAEQLLAAKAASQRYVEGFLKEGGDFCEWGLLFVGPPGVGKTHLAVAVMRELMSRFGRRGLFVDFTSLIHQIQSTFDPSSSESKHDVLDPVIRAEVLVLDELGAQKPTAWVNDILYLIMNTRYTRRLPTLFTTNYRLQPAQEAEAALDGPGGRGSQPLLASRISANLVSRLYEMARLVEIEAEDFRREVQRQRLLV